MRAIPLCLLFALACSAPKRDYTADQIASETEFDKLMHVQATVADPRFKLAKKLDAANMTGNDFEQFLDMGRRLQLTSGRIGQIAKSDFGGLNAQLGKQAKQLEIAAGGKDGAATLKAARAIEKTCATCHAEYR